MIIEKFIYLLFFYNRLYIYLLSLLFIKNIRLLKSIKLEPSTQNISTVYSFIENIFCYIINTFIKYLLFIYNFINIFFNQPEDQTNNFIKKTILFIYHRINDLDNKLYNMLMNYIKDVLFKKITAQIMEEMTKTSKDNNIGGLDKILSNSMRMFDDIIKNTKFDKNDLNKLSQTVNRVKNDDMIQKLVSDLQTNKDIKKNNNLILSSLKDKLN